MLSFDNSFARLDVNFYTHNATTPLHNPSWIIKNSALASELEISLNNDPEKKLLRAFSGGQPLPGSQPLAMVYAGHQFGQYVSQLGDGRGVLLGELKTSAGQWDLHLKGAGLTPYSRGGDGRAVLRSSLREYIASEALAALEVPGTRALCVTSGTDTVWRETLEPAAMLVRVAKSHVRFGSFEFFHYSGQLERVKELADYCIEKYYPEITNEQRSQRYISFFKAVIKRTAILIAKWQAVGFAHGVMNTDNMSIVGDTFDFGPYGFMDRYNEAYVCNHSDHQGRYAFNAQPGIGLWNLNALGHALSSLIETADLQEALAEYEPQLITHYSALMLSKLGLVEQQPDDALLINSLLSLMQANGADYTLTFRGLANINANIESSALVQQFSDKAGLQAWLTNYRARLQNNDIRKEQRQKHMNEVNPLYIARNHLAQEAIEGAENGDYTELHNLMQLLAAPYMEQPNQEKYAAAAPAWSHALKISCSS